MHPYRHSKAGDRFVYILRGVKMLHKKIQVICRPPRDFTLMSKCAVHKRLFCTGCLFVELIRPISLKAWKFDHIFAETQNYFIRKNQNKIFYLGEGGAVNNHGILRKRYTCMCPEYVCVCLCVCVCVSQRAVYYYLRADDRAREIPSHNNYYSIYTFINVLCLMSATTCRQRTSDNDQV